VRITAAAVSLLALVGCGGAGGATGSKLLDEQRGTYQGVGIGSSSAAVRARFGEPPSSQGFVPLEPDGVQGPYAFSVSGHGVPSVMRYDRVAFVLAYDRVFGLITSDRGVVLDRGVGVGDSLERVKAAYPFSCREAHAGEGAGGRTPTYTLCHAALANGSQLVVTKDPVESITLLHLAAAKPPARTRLIDERAGTISGVGIGDTMALVEDRFGKPLHSSATAPRFRGLTFSVQDGRVVAFTASSRRDMTTTAASVGDPLGEAAARYRYPPLRCTGAVCTGMTRYSRYVRLTGDPIRSITVSSAPLR
jgi:hypothetical protein